MHTLVVLNPVAGRRSPQEIKSKLKGHFELLGWDYEIYETTGRDDVRQVVEDALARGVKRVYACGGDGTVSAVASGLINSDIPLGIIPTGTGNVLAQELKLPLKFEDACNFLANTQATKAIDGLSVNGKLYLLGVGAGADSLTIQQTKRQQKRRFGSLAYMWAAFKVLLGMQPRRFIITADGKALQDKASIVLLSNVGTLTRPLRWGPHIRPDDGRIDISVVRGRHLFDYILAGWDLLPGKRGRPKHIRYIAARERIRIEVDKTLPVQGDGDLIGQTPFEARVIPGAVNVLTPSP